MSRRNFLAYFLLTSCLVSGQSPRYVLKGQKVTLKKDITGQPDNILWTHNGNKVVEFNGMEQRVYDPYKSRVTLDWLSAELHISDLRLEDSGKYELQVSVNQNLDKSYHDVEILDRVVKPTISCKIHNSSNSGTLVCSAEPRQPVHLMKLEWHSQGSVHPGPHLQISLGDELDEQVYSCMVSNPLTTETTSFTAKDCYSTKSSSLALTVIVIVISLLLLIAGAGILYCYLKQKGCFAKRETDLEKQKTDQIKGSGATVETNEATPFIDGKSSSGKSSVGAFKVSKCAAETEQLSDSTDEEKQQGGGDPDKSDESESDEGPFEDAFEDLEQNSKDHQNAEASSSSVPHSDAGQNKDDINDKNTTVEDHLTEAPDKQEGHASNKSGSPAESADIGQNTSSEQKSSTAPASPVLDPGNSDKSESDAQQSSKVPLGKATFTASDKSKPPASSNSSFQSDSNLQRLREPVDEAPPPDVNTETETDTLTDQMANLSL